MTHHGGVFRSGQPDPLSRRDRFADIAFSGGGLDRFSEKRDDPQTLAGLAADPRAVCFVFGREMIAFQGETPLFAFAERESFGALRETVLLGVDAEGAPHYALQLDERAVEAVGEKDPTVSWDNRRLALTARPDLEMRDLRSLAAAGAVSLAVLSRLAQAKALLAWHARHRFCSNCGAPSQLAAAGWRRDCPACNGQHFPRTDPVVIMLAISADGQRCLLGRQPRFPKGMYSALAGFVEPGEMLEEAVRRELFEEAGVRCEAVAYLGSQPWPFPMNLMIGCLARARSDELNVDRAELEDARWFDRAEAIALLEGRHPDGLKAPQPIAIAHWLLRSWAVEDLRP